MGFVAHGPAGPPVVVFLAGLGLVLLSLMVVFVELMSFVAHGPAGQAVIVFPAAHGSVLLA